MFITGASSGIGERLAKRLTQLGASTIILAARRITELRRVKKECEELKVNLNQKIIIMLIDLNEPDMCF